MSFTDRTYATAQTLTLGNVDFSQIMETSANTVRKSVDESQFVLKWDTNNIPTFITNGSVTVTWSGSHADCLTLMNTSAWTEEE